MTNGIHPKLKNLIIILASLIFWAVILQSIPMEFYDLGGDSAQYIILAENLSQGKGWHMVNYPGEPLSNLPPIFPLLLAPILYFFGRNFWLMHLAVCILAYISLMLFYKIFRQDSPEEVAILAIFLLAINGLFLSYSLRILSDIPFLFLSGFTLYFLIKYRQKQIALSREGGLTAIGFVTAYLCRYVGIFLFFIGVFYLLSEKANSLEKKGQIKKILFLSLGFLPIFLFWNFRNLCIYNPFITSPENYKPYLRLLTLNPFILMSRFINGINFYFFRIAETTFFIYKIRSLILQDMLLITIVIIILTGLWSEIKKKKYAFTFYVVIYLTLISLWPHYEDGRYIIPILPFILFYFSIGFYKILNTFPKKISTYLFIGSLFYFLISLSSSLPVHKSSLEELSPHFKNFISLHKWIEKNLPPSGLIISRKPTVTYFFTNHKSTGYPFTLNPDEIWKSLLQHDAKYILVDEFSRETYYYLSPFLYKYKNKLILVYRIGNTGLFEIRKWGEFGLP